MRSIELIGKNNLELKKHVGLIHSTNKLSLLERKIANALLYNAYENLLSKNEHKIHIPSLCVLIGYNSKDIKTIKKSLMALISTVLEWNLLDQESQGDDGIWMASSMLSDAKIEGSICTYSYSNRMKELCYYPEFYGRLNIKVLAAFKSTYGLALYENCIRYQNISQTPWFDIPTYRKLMGVAQDKYTVFRDLNRRVIKQAVKEVNDHAPICIKPEFKKEGREVVAIRFKISKQLEEGPIFEHLRNNEIEKNLADKLNKDYGLSTAQVKEAIDKYEENYLIEKMTLIESSNSYKEGKIKNLAKYLEKALLEDYRAPKSSQEHVQKYKKQKAEKEEQEKQKQNNILEYKKYLNQSIGDLYKNLSEERKHVVEKGFEECIKNSIYHTIFLREGFRNILVFERFCEYIRSSQAELIINLKSFKDFAVGLE